MRFFNVTATGLVRTPRSIGKRLTVGRLAFLTAPKWKAMTRSAWMVPLKRPPIVSSCAAIVKRPPKRARRYSPIVRMTLLSGRVLFDDSLSSCESISSYFGTVVTSPFGTMCTTL